MIIIYCLWKIFQFILIVVKFFVTFSAIYVLGASNADLNGDLVPMWYRTQTMLVESDTVKCVVIVHSFKLNFLA